MRHTLLLSILFLGVTPNASAQSVSDPALAVTTFVSDASLSPATALKWAPDGTSRLFVVKKTGDVRLIENGILLSEPFLTEPAVYTNSEGGLLGIAFDPDYLLNRYVYFFVSVSASRQLIVRYTDRGTHGDERTVIGGPLPTAGANHVGGGLAFGADGYLYWGIGDLGNGSGVDADLTSLASKIGRAFPDGRPAPDNPFNDGVGPNNEFIYARGFRNPFGLAVRPDTGALWVNVAGTSYEQLFEVTRGAHAGFNDYEANQPATAPYIAPRIAYRTNGTDSIAIASGGATRHNGIVTFTTTAPHRLRPGQRLTISGMGPDTTFNGVVYVSTVPGLSSFTAIQFGADATSGGGTAITDALGGAVTRGVFNDATLLPSEYAGNYFFGDFNSGRIVRAQFQETEVTRVDAWGEGFSSNVDLAVGPDGAVYTIGLTGGVIRRIAPHIPAPGLVLTERHLRVVVGSERRVAVRLSAAPDEDVVVGIVGEHPRLTVQPASLTFTAQDWDVPQWLNVRAIAAAPADSAEFRLEAEGLLAQTLSVTAMERRSQAFGAEPREGIVLERGASAEVRVFLQLHPGAHPVPVTARLEGTASLLSITSGSEFSLTIADWSDGGVVVLEAATSETLLDEEEDVLVLEAPGIPPFRIPIVVAGVEPPPDDGPDAGTEPDAGADAGTDAGSDAGTDAGDVPPIEDETTGCGCNGSGAAGTPLLLGALLFLRRMR